MPWVMSFLYKNIETFRMSFLEVFFTVSLDPFCNGT
jgi:hypothetical protein